MQPAYDARLESLRAGAEAAAIDALVITNPASIYYLTGFEALQLERFFAVVVTVRGGGVLLVPQLERDAAHQAPTGLWTMAYDLSSDGFGQLKEALSGAAAVGVEEDHLSFGRALRLSELGVRICPSSQLLRQLRLRKDADEVEAIRRACGVIATVINRLFAWLRTGDTERATNARISLELAAAGASETHLTVLFGPNAANPHGKAGDRELRVGDVVCADISACVDGYWGDLTRCGTVGPPTEWARKTWSVVRSAQAAAIKTCTVGTKALDVDAAQRRVLDSAPELGSSLHGAGHAIGVEVHEPPFLVPTSEQTMQPGLVLTIEPGLYASGLGGIRLEDDVLVTDGGPQLLSSLPLDLRQVQQP